LEFFFSRKFSYLIEITVEYRLKITFTLFKVVWQQFIGEVGKFITIMVSSFFWTLYTKDY